MRGEDDAEEEGLRREALAVDLACVGFGPAVGGFLTTLSRRLSAEDSALVPESLAAPGMPVQVVCYERADDLAFGVSGVATRAAALKASFPDLEAAGIPHMARIEKEKLCYLMDPTGASRRSPALKLVDRILRAARSLLPMEKEALELPFIPPYLRKEGGLVLSIGQLNQWVASQVLSQGAVQIWPGTPVASPLIEGKSVVGVRLLDQGFDEEGRPGAAFMPGMDIRASLTVVGDGPVGAVGRLIDERIGVPEGHSKGDWAIGMKAVVDLRDDAPIAPGTVIHTFGFPEPEIFGFLYTHGEGVASVGIFVPSSFKSPVRTSYRYLQHFMLHPYLWQFLEGGTMRSWGAKTLGESGRRGEPFLAGDGYARIGEGSGSTNVLTGSGVDEAWATGVCLAEGVIELLSTKKPFTRENLERAYVLRRRASWVEKGAQEAETARDGFHHGFLPGLLGMAWTGLSSGHAPLFGVPRPARIKTLAEYFKDLPEAELASIQRECRERGVGAHDILFEKSGWPAIPYDGRLLVSHQDALLLGGKVQASAGYADHVVFKDKDLCRRCGELSCVEVCSGQALGPGPDGVPLFDKEKCVHCGACQWSCILAPTGNSNIELKAGVGGLHSAEN